MFSAPAGIINLLSGCGCSAHLTGRAGSFPCICVFTVSVSPVGKPTESGGVARCRAPSEKVCPCNNNPILICLLRLCVLDYQNTKRRTETAAV